MTGDAIRDSRDFSDSRDLSEVESERGMEGVDDSLSSSDRLNEVLLVYLEECEAGRCPDREELLDAYPDLRDDLLLFFAEQDRLDGLGGFLRRNVIHTHPGQLGDFRLIREVGRGGMATVYEAEQISLKRRVALKTLPFVSAVDPRQLQRFRNEASAAAHLRHENIVSVFAVGCERGVHYFAMQYVDGQSLAALIAEKRRLRDRKNSETTIEMGHVSTEPQFSHMSWCDWVVEIGKQAALALEHAHHSGVVHRDIKPGNLMLDINGHLWITDFGLAQVASDHDLTMSGELLGTLRYASPEQMEGRRGTVDHRTDIYSLGATLFELLTLRPALDGRDRQELLQQIAVEDPPLLRSLNPQVAESLETIVLKTLRKNPSERYMTAQDLADDLQRFLDRTPVMARPPKPTELLWAWMRRHPKSLLAGMTAMICVTFFSILIAILVGAERERTRAAQQLAHDAYLAEQKRAEEAVSRLLLARRAVDELIVISDEELAGRPEMLLLRKRLLRSALTFYQEFLKEREGDTKTQTELLETAERVQRILADLEVLRSTTEIALLRNPIVLDELRVSDEQRSQVHTITSRAWREWLESFREIGISTQAQRAHNALIRAKDVENALSETLTSQQLARLRQLRLQSEGATAFRDQDVAVTLGLTAQQREQIRQIEDDVAFQWVRESRGPHSARTSSDSNDSKKQDTSDAQNVGHEQSTGREPVGANHESAVVNREPTTEERIQKVLTKEQSEKWHELTGVRVRGLKIPSRPPKRDHPGNSGEKLRHHHPDRI